MAPLAGHGGGPSPPSSDTNLVFIDRTLTTTRPRTVLGRPFWRTVLNSASTAERPFLGRTRPRSLVLACGGSLVTVGREHRGGGERCGGFGSLVSTLLMAEPIHDPHADRTLEGR